MSAPDTTVAALSEPFRLSETKQWEQRKRILELLDSIYDLTDEARLCLDWRENHVAEGQDEKVDQGHNALLALRTATQRLFS